MWNEIITLFREYMGTGCIVLWYLAALVYLAVTEKRKHFRILFVYVPAIVLLLFFNPLFAKIFYKVAEDEIYYRILWLIPITMTLALAIVDIYGRLKNVIIKLGFLAAAAVIVMLSGSYIYHNQYFRPAENLYHIPRIVVDVCDSIEVEGREVMAVFPVEMLQYVRQYSATVCMPYGREITVSRWENYSDLFDEMQAEVVDAKKLTTLAREEGCVYIILPKERNMIGSICDYEFEIFDEMHGYAIYKDSTVDLAIQ